MSLCIEIWSDVICPWCYIGKRRFEMALANFAQRDSVPLSPALMELLAIRLARQKTTAKSLVISRERERGTRTRYASFTLNVIWRSFELDPNAPRQHPGTLEEMLAHKYGVSPQQAAAMNARVTGVAREVGLEYRLADAHAGNTFDAHRLQHFATSLQLGDRATERIMHAYFCEGLAVGDRNALARLAPEFGIAKSEALAMLESDAFSGEVRADEARAAKLEITGVPFFLINEKTGISGAQPVEAFAESLQQAWDDAQASETA